MSILFTILLLLVIIGFPFLLRRLQISRFGYWLLGGYFILLIASVIAYTFIPTEEFVDEEELPAEMTNRIYLVHEILDQGVQLEEFEQYKKEEWEFPTATEESFSLESFSLYASPDYQFPVIIKRVEDQEAIHVDYYEVTPEIDVEPVYDEGEVTVYNHNGELTLEVLGYKLYRFNSMEKGFPFNQFEEEDHSWIYYDVFDDERMFYITIPADIELNVHPDTDVHWLN
ncbi:hypothetical protein WKU33_02545 [Oceanobacillus sp. HCA-5259]|uniref:hypothetical protein n=1 Tax=Oceanobacillus sp. HCA-5259 TaxID=3134661 RepID=UPI0030C262E9